jgi:hypothetical protein
MESVSFLGFECKQLSRFVTDSSTENGTEVRFQVPEVERRNFEPG